MRNHAQSGRRAETIFFSICGAVLLAGVIAVFVLSATNQEETVQPTSGANTISVAEEETQPAEKETDGKAEKSTVKSGTKSDSHMAQAGKSTTSSNTARQEENERYQKEVDELEEEYQTKIKNQTDLKQLFQQFAEREQGEIDKLNEKIEQDIQNGDLYSPGSDQDWQLISIHETRRQGHLESAQECEAQIEKLQNERDSALQAAKEKHETNLKKLPS